MEGFAEAQKILANSNEEMTYQYTVVYADFRKGGGGGAEKLRLMKTRMKIFQPKINFVFLPKLRWRPKKKV